MYSINFTSIGIHMFAAIRQFFAMFTVLFSAGEKSAKAIEHMASWAEESSAQFNEEARSQRKQRQAIHKAKMTLIEGTAESIAKQELEYDAKHKAALAAKEAAAE